MSEQEYQVTVTRQILVDIFAATVYAVACQDGIEIPEPPDGYEKRIDEWMQAIVEKYNIHSSPSR